MTNFIPIFPLKLVVYPGEKLNLHIFEPRYKQMIRECLAAKKPFGLPPVIGDKLSDHGTIMEITEVVKEYDNGELDIRTRGTQIFTVLEVIRDIPEKLYTGAIVTYPPNEALRTDTQLSRLILSEVKRMYDLLNATEKFPEEQKDMLSYDIAHFVGLSIEQEYELLSIFTELQRLEFIRRHLTNILPVIKELEEMKARISRNGHFRDLSLGDLKL